MTDFQTLLQQGASHAWLFIPSAIALGALHGLEPGHSKTMMAAFIVAIRGTVWQAVLLGLSATLSHTLVVWIIALGGLYFGRKWDAHTSEPYLQIASAVIMVMVALWMWSRIPRSPKHDHDHDHPEHDHHHPFSHEAHDAHAAAHAREIEQRFTGRHVTTGQVMMFGLTGGLIPCPASITVLLLCLQLKQVALGVTLVLCFSIGLALTLVLSGVVAAFSLKHVGERWPALTALTQRAPYISVVLILIVALVVGYHGVQHLIQS